MNVHDNISEISAEMLLNYLYPELEDKWVVHSDGTFYRNYNSDILSVDATDADVHLSRDGFLRLLPQGVLTWNNELKEGDFLEKYEALEKRRRLLNEAFLPFDTFAFRSRLRIERNISQLLETKLEYILKQYFHYDITLESNPYVKEAAVLLPYVSRWRGNYGFIRNLLGSLMGCEVRMTTGKYSQTDNTRCWLPMIEYHLLISGLTSEKYRRLTEDIRPLALFIKEWFIPFEVKCIIRLREYQRQFALNDSMTLDYNVELNK